MTQDFQHTQRVTQRRLRENKQWRSAVSPRAACPPPPTFTLLNVRRLPMAATHGESAAAVTPGISAAATNGKRVTGSLTRNSARGTTLPAIAAAAILLREVLPGGMAATAAAKISAAAAKPFSNAEPLAVNQRHQLLRGKLPSPFHHQFHHSLPRKNRFMIAISRHFHHSALSITAAARFYYELGTENLELSFVTVATAIILRGILPRHSAAISATGCQTVRYTISQSKIKLVVVNLDEEQVKQWIE